MSANSKQRLQRRAVGGNVWLSHERAENGYLSRLPAKDLNYEILSSEEAVGRAMLDEITSAAAAKDGSLVLVILGGRGGQALHRLLGAMARTNEHDALF